MFFFSITFGKLWAEVYGFIIAIAYKGGKKLQKHINYLQFNVYSGLQTAIVDIVIWKTAILMVLKGTIVDLLKLLQLWFNFNVGPIWKSLYFYILWYPLLCAWLMAVKP